MSDSTSDPVERAGHVAELALLESAVQSSGYHTETTEPVGSAEFPELIVHLDNDEESRSRSMRISFIPVGDDMDAAKFLQLWTALPFTAGPDVIDDVRRAATIVNEHTAIGRFGVDANGGVYFRYVLAARQHTMIDGDLLAEIVSFVDFHQEHFGDFLEGVCTGNIAVEVLDNVIAAAG